MFVFRLFYIFCCLIIPKFENKIIFYSYPDASDNSWALFNHYAKKTDSASMRFVWLCEQPEAERSRLDEVVRGSGHRLTIVKKQSLRGILHFCSAAYAFTTTRFYPFVVPGFGPVVTSVWHGMPIKKLGLYKLDQTKKRTPFDYLVSTSPFFSEVMAHAFGMPVERVLPLGLPRNDALLNPRAGVKEQLWGALSIPGNQGVVFWLPTYRKMLDRYGAMDGTHASFLGDWEDGWLARLDALAAERELTVVIKLHPADQMNEWAEGESLHYKNIRVIGFERWRRIGVDLYAALSVSGGLISDVSSVLVDYLIVNKPIGVTRNALDSYKRGVISEVEPLLDEFMQVNNEQDFSEFLGKVGTAVRWPETVLKKYNTQAWHKRCASLDVENYLSNR